MRRFVLYVDGVAVSEFGGVQFETKLGAITAADTRRFTMTEVSPSGNGGGPHSARGKPSKQVRLWHLASVHAVQRYVRYRVEHRN